MNNEKVKFLLNWNHFTDHLSSCMTKLMTDISYSDIIIATADKHMIYSHRFVLANSSKYFQRLLRHIKRRKEIQLVVALPEIKYEIFKILMNYMYKGETQVPHELLPSVIKAGQFLEINGLVNLNDSENNSTSETPTKHNHPGGEIGSRSSAMHSTNSSSNQVPKEGKKPTANIRDNLNANTGIKETAGNCLKGVFRFDKRTRTQSMKEKSSEQPVTEENGKENRSKITKSPKAKIPSREGKDVIQLPLKRKSSSRETSKKSSPVPSPTSSLSMDGSPPKKIVKRISTSQESEQLKVKAEKENNRNCASPENKNPEPDDSQDKITIKEEPDDVEEVVYNELQCEFCHEVYTNPSDWVKHMTEHHKDRGYQSYKDLDKSGGGSTVITCVVCSCVCFSAAEWANHLRMWHTDRELAVANMTTPKKNNSKIKKKSGSSKNHRNCHENA